jgi:hypothetical protein
MITKFGEGYQEALADVARAFAKGGEEAAREWVKVNLYEPVRDEDGNEIQL